MVALSPLTIDCLTGDRIAGQDEVSRSLPRMQVVVTRNFFAAFSFVKRTYVELKLTPNGLDRG